MGKETAVENALRYIRENEKRTVEKHLISVNTMVLEALSRLNELSGDALTLFAVNDDGTLAGSLTDGDIRRALISGKTLQTQVGDICKRNCLTLTSASTGNLVIAEARKLDIILLPAVNDGYITSLIDLRRTKGLIPVQAVLMAGGMGERLKPLTATTPKPLLKIGNKAIIDYNIDLLESYGIKEIFITVNYLKDKIINHIEKRASTDTDTKIKCVEEPERLGTIGSLSLIDELKSENIIVMNSDLLTDIDLEEMYLKHTESVADITVAVIPYTVSVPFAILEHDGDKIKGIIEKPTYNYFASAGIYILKEDIVKSISRSYLDAPDLIERLIKKGSKIDQYPLRGRWIDIGSPDDYRYACDIMKQ